MFQNKKLKRNATYAIAEVAEVALCASNCALPTSASPSKNLSFSNAFASNLLFRNDHRISGFGLKHIYTNLLPQQTRKPSEKFGIKSDYIQKRPSTAKYFTCLYVFKHPLMSITPLLAEMISSFFSLFCSLFPKSCALFFS